MKIALVVAPPQALPTAFVVFRDRLDISLRKARDLGYDGVELALAGAGEVDVPSMRRLLADEGMRLSAVSTGRVGIEQKVSLSDPDERVRRRAVEITRGLIDLAAALGSPRVNVGRLRGHIHEGDSLETTQSRFFEGISLCDEYAVARGIGIVLEPVNRYETNYVNSVLPDGIDIVRRLGRSNVLLMPDVFHMNIEDASISESLVAAGPLVGYVHLADSNRWAPGQGHTDFPAILGALESIGYDGDLGVEILPYPSPDEGAAQAIHYLRTLIPRL
ncbi:MAG: sugar phosphate isomerase/epimerase family protein [Candidatus Limnocylindrales bacterium]